MLASMTPETRPTIWIGVVGPMVTAASGQLADYVKRFPGEEDAALEIRNRARASNQAAGLLGGTETLTAGR
jgi:hypothetical protein